MKVRMGFVSNSSSSSFICKTKMSLSQVKEKLEKIHSFYWEVIKDSEEDYYLGKSFNDMFFKPFEGNKEYDKKLKDWDYLKEYGVDGTTVGKIVIESAEDNSIPYEMFELIEKVFNGVRLHLG